MADADKPAVRKGELCRVSVCEQGSTTSTNTVYSTFPCARLATLLAPPAVLSTLLESEHYESLIRELVCTACSQFMKPPIHICVDGHSICGGCYKTAYQCHICKKEISQVRSVVLESLAQKVLLPCSNKGCPKRLTQAQHARHAGTCQYRIIDCFMARVYVGECSWKGRAGDWLDHCFVEHQKRVTDLPFITVRDRWNPKRADPVINYFLMRCYDRVFNVYQIYDRKGGRMMWTVLVNDEHAEKFYYEIDIFLPKQPAKKIVYRRPCKCEKDADFLEHTQNVYVPVENIFSMLDDAECTHFTARIGEVENLPLLETAAGSASLILLTDEAEAPAPQEAELH